MSIHYFHDQNNSNMMKLLCVILIAGLAAGNPSVNIDDRVDQFLESYNQLFTSHHIGIQKLPPLVFFGAEVSSGYHVGMNSLARTGNCTISVSSDNVTVTTDFHVGYRLMALGFGSIKTKSDEFSGVISVRNNSLHLQYDVTLSPRCNVTLGALEVEALSNATLQASLPQYNQDVSEYLGQYVRPAINRMLYKTRQFAEATLQRLICHHSMPMEEHIPKLLNLISLY